MHLNGIPPHDWWQFRPLMQKQKVHKTSTLQISRYDHYTYYILCIFQPLQIIFDGWLPQLVLVKSCRIHADWIHFFPQAVRHHCHRRERGAPGWNEAARAARGGLDERSGDCWGSKWSDTWGLTHGAFHSHGGTPETLVGFHGKSPSKIRMITGATSMT